MSVSQPGFPLFFRSVLKKGHKTFMLFVVVFLFYMKLESKKIRVKKGKRSVVPFS